MWRNETCGLEMFEVETGLMGEEAGTETEIWVGGAGTLLWSGQCGEQAQEGNEGCETRREDGMKEKIEAS